MRAVRWHGRRDVRVEDVEEPVPSRGEVLVKVAYCGICGTDVREYADGPKLIRRNEHPLTGARPPITLGHEFSGQVVDLGPGVEGIELGTRVAVDPCWRCGRCEWCVRGDYHICRYGGSVGLASDGALAPFVRVQVEGLVPLPETVDDKSAALAEPLAVGLHGVRRSGVQPGDSILVLGAGPVGIAVLLAAMSMGVSSTFISEPQSSRRELAEEFGAITFDPTVDDVRRETYLATGRIGPDAVFECTGRPDMLPFAVECARRGGSVVLLGIGQRETSLDPSRVVLYERRIIGSLGYRRDVERVVSLMEADKIDPLPMVGRIATLDDVPDILEDATVGGDLVKILVRVGEVPE